MRCANEQLFLSEVLELETLPEGTQQTIAELIKAFADHEPPLSSLGAALLVDTETTQRLVRMGRVAVPKLIEALNGENPKIAMYSAYCLGQIGDRSALPALRQMKERYMAHEPKREFDFSVISAISQAEEKLLRLDQSVD